MVDRAELYLADEVFFVGTDWEIKPDEVFFVGTDWEIKPVALVDRIVVNDGKVGKITSQI